MAELKAGSTLQNGKYKILKTLGRGSFGITYLASGKMTVTGSLGRMEVNVNVTVKEFFMSDLNSRSSDGTTVEKTSSSLVQNYRGKFRKEAENLSKLHHKNIVKVLEVFEENNTAYYVMEFIDGETLEDYIKRNGRLSADESLHIAREVCSALSYMHEHKMLHLDLKPKNIMRDTDGGIHLIDFGLAKQYNENGEPESSTTLGLGTPGYAPIEQAHYKQDGSFPVTLDIYALGATLYKMLTGKTPPEASFRLSEGLSLDGLSAAGVPQPVVDIVNKAMALVRKDRFQTVDALQRAIAALGSGPAGDEDETDIGETPVREPKPTPTPAPEPTPGPTPKPSPLKKYGAFAAALLAGLLVFWLWPKNPQPDNPIEPEIQTVAETTSQLPEENPQPTSVAPQAMQNPATPVKPEEHQPEPVKPAESKPATGSLSVNSNPSGATVLIDGKERGTTPVEVSNLSLGKHQLKVQMQGYEDLTQNVTVKEGVTSELILALSAKSEEQAPSQVVQQTQNTVSNTASSSASSQTFTVAGVSFKMVKVEGGTFQMGSNDSDANSDEKPVHSVTLSDYYIGETEVTQALWTAVMGTSVSQQRDKADKSWNLYGIGDNYPMYYVSWNDCQDFIRELNRLTGKRFRLPTEAEWEYAARGGRKSTGAKYAGSDAVSTVAWYTDNSGSTTHPVKGKRPNELGLYDMSGNVWEWCQDWKGSYSSGSQTNPKGPTTGSYRVNRGGGWSYNARFCRVSYRFHDTPGSRGYYLGLRLAL